MRQMAHLLMDHLGKSRSQAPVSGMGMFTGKTGKEEKEMVAVDKWCNLHAS